MTNVQSFPTRIAENIHLGNAEKRNHTAGLKEATTMRRGSVAFVASWESSNNSVAVFCVVLQ